MAEEILIAASGDKKVKYETLLPQIESLILSESDAVANMANICACLRQTFDFFWVGFYVVKGERLILGPFQGPVACTGIMYGRGVCGTAWKQSETIIVDDVEKFPGHIACSSLSRSEIVVPVIKDGNVYGVLDVDSNELSGFDLTDKLFLEKICDILAQTLPD